MLNVRHSVLPTMLYVDGMRRIARLMKGRLKRLPALRDEWPHDSSTSRRHHGMSGISIVRKRTTPSPDAAERPAPQRAMTRFALASESRKDCISSGVIGI